MGKIKILFICHGNICRSPMSEFVLKDMVEQRGLTEQFEIASAATSTEEIWNGKGNPIYPPAQAELKKHGIGKTAYTNFAGKRAQTEADCKAMLARTQQEIQQRRAAFDRRASELLDGYHSTEFLPEERAK